MAITVVDEPELRLTRAELERYRGGYRKSQAMTVSPSSSEVWLRKRLAREKGRSWEDAPRLPGGLR